VCERTLSTPPPSRPDSPLNAQPLPDAPAVEGRVEGGWVGRGGRQVVGRWLVAGQQLVSSWSAAGQELVRKCLHFVFVRLFPLAAELFTPFSREIGGLRLEIGE
jgi:hypothetical protein